MRNKLFLILLGLCFSVAAFAQTRTVTGVVNSVEDDSPLLGATVRVPGTPAGAITDIDGRFSIEVPDGNDQLQISYVGYETQTINIAGQSNVSIAMSTGDTDIEVVTITTYGKDGATPVTGALTLIDNSEIEGVPIASFEQTLQGKAPGLTVLSGSGQPGTPATVKIRGTNTISAGTAPLYILDGQPLEAGEFASLNPNDFEVIAILKDAASTAVYGSRATNGVIALKTKTGKVGKTRVNYSGQYGFSNPGRQEFDMMNSQELLAFQQLAGRGAGWTLSPQANPGATPAQLAANATELARLSAIDNDFRDVFFREGRTNVHDLSFSGGSAETRFFVSLGYYDEEGIGLRSELERKTARVNLDHDVSDRFRIALKTSVGNGVSSFVESENSISLANPFAAAYLGNPFETLRDANGNILFQGNDPNGINANAGYVAVNAYDRLIEDSNIRDEFKGNGSVSLEYDVMENLTLKTFAGIDYRNRQFERFQDPDSYGGNLVSRGNDGSLSETSARLKAITTIQTLNYFHEFNPDNLIDVVLGYEFLDRQYEQETYTGYDLSPLFPGITPNQIEYTDPITGEPVAAVGGRKSRNQLSSGFAIANYTFMDRYTLGATFRQDASSRFGPNNKEAKFWSVSGKWDVMGENFMQNSNTVDLLRLRASYGTTGNQLGTGATTDTGNFPYLGQLVSGTLFGEATLANSTRIPDPDLQWETAYKTDIGIDFGLFDRISGSLDLYNTKTTDLFIQEAISGTTGTYTIPLTNAGSLRNRGIELEIEGDVLQKSNFTWNVGANLAYNNNEVLDLSGEDEFISGTSIIRTGEELGAHYIEGWAGVDPATGDPLYLDVNGDVTRDFNLAEATTGWGSFNPPWIGGLNTSLEAHGFSVFAQFNFAAEYARFNNQTFFQENANFAQFNLSRIMNTVWQQPGDITEIQRIGTGREFSSKDIERADFIRFRNLNASYTLPESIINKVSALRSATIFVNGTNLFTWTQFTGFDPEDSNNIAGYEYPLPRQMTAGIKLGL